MQDNVVDLHGEHIWRWPVQTSRQMLGRRIFYEFWYAFMPQRIRPLLDGLLLNIKVQNEEKVSQDNIGYLQQ